MKVPVTIIIFNRQDTIQLLIESIRDYKPTDVFIIADGPRAGYSDDAELCKHTRTLVEGLINWECIIHKDYSSINLGLGARVKTGLDWVFSKVEYSIILEDDCIPSLSFFLYCEELLELYKNDKRIMHISGNNYTPKFNPPDISYFFSLYGHIWGWATWARAWQLIDYELEKWEDEKNRTAIKSLFRDYEFSYFENIFHDYKLNKRKPWGYRWFYSRMLNNGLSIIPASNLVTNAGITGTNTSKKANSHFRKIDEQYAISNHPPIVQLDSNYDLNHFKKHINPKRNLIKRMISKIF